MYNPPYTKGVRFLTHTKNEVLTAMKTFDYIITTFIGDIYLHNSIRHGSCGQVISTSKNRKHGPKTFIVRSAQQWATITDTLAGNGDYNCTIVRLGSQSGLPLFEPVTVKTLN